MFSGDRKIPTQGPTAPVENEACRVSHLTVDPRVGIFLSPRYTSDGFFFSHIPFGDVLYAIVGDVTVDVYKEARYEKKISLSAKNVTK